MCIGTERRLRERGKKRGWEGEGARNNRERARNLEECPGGTFVRELSYVCGRCSVFSRDTERATRKEEREERWRIGLSSRHRFCLRLLQGQAKEYRDIGERETRRRARARRTWPKRK